MGSSRWIARSRALTRSITSSALALGSTQTPMNTAFLPEKRTSWSYSSAPSTTSATSSRRTSAPFCSRITSFLNPSTERRSVVAVTVHLDQRPLGLCRRRPGSCWRPAPARTCDGADVERRHPIGLEPRAQRERPRAQDLRALHAVDRRQPRLHDPDQVVGDLVVLRGRRTPKLRYIAAICASEGSIWIAGTCASGGRSART